MPFTLRISCVPMGKSRPDNTGNSHGKLDVLITPQCDAGDSIMPMLRWAQEVVDNARAFRLQGYSGSLSLNTGLIRAELWNILFNDAKATAGAVKPTPITPHGVRLRSTHDGAHEFFRAALTRPISPSNAAPQLDFLRSFHTQAIKDHGLYGAQQPVAPPAPTQAERAAIAALTTAALTPQNAEYADTLISRRFGIPAPRIGPALGGQNRVLAASLASGQKHTVTTPSSATLALAHLKLHLTNSLLASEGRPFNPMTNQPQPDHLLFHVNRLTASASGKRAAGSQKIAAANLSQKPYSFNQRITMLLNMPALLEALGLVLHFELPWDAASRMSTVQLVLPDALLTNRQQVNGMTHVNGNFLPRTRPTLPTDPPSPMRPNGWMEPNDGYHSGSLQLDSAAMQITQFASQAGLRQAALGSGDVQPVTTSYDEDVEHPILPPSPHTGGLQVWQDNRQAKIAARRDAIVNAPVNSNPDLFAEDLINGVVVDIQAKNPQNSRDPGTWLSLCVRDEEFRFSGISIKADSVERSVKIAASQSSDPAIPATLSSDVDETVFTWRLGSLVVKSKVAPKGIRSGSPLTSAVKLPWHTLPQPRLSDPQDTPSPLFGWSYLVAMRAGFVTGGVVPFDATTAAAAAMPPVTFQRYELVQGPVSIPVLLTEHYLKHQTPSLLFVGSHVNDDLSIHHYAAVSQRVLVPPQVHADLARRHGKTEDLIAVGATVLPLRDGALPKEIDLSLALAPPSSGVYLPDPLCSGVIAVLTNLSGVVLASQTVNFYGDGVTWPEYIPHVVQVQTSDAPVPSLGVANVTSAPSALPFLRSSSRALTCNLPAGMTCLLVLRPQLDNSAGNLAAVHALSTMTPAGDAQSLDAALLAFSDVCRPTTLRLTHATDRPLTRPVLIQDPPLTSNRESISDVTTLKLGATVDGGSTSKVALRANWQEFTDDLAKAAYTVTPMLAQLSETDIRKIETKIPPDFVRFPFSDGRYRKVFITARGTARYGEAFGTEGGGIRTLDSLPLTLDILATKAPPPPDIEYVLPNLRWQIAKKKRTRTMGLTIVLNRPWFSSGAGEQLAIITAPYGGNGSAFVDSISTSLPPNAENDISAWGVLNDWFSALPKGAAKQTIKIAADPERRQDTDAAAPSADADDRGIVTIEGQQYCALFFAPRYNEQDQQWFVNLSLPAPPAYGTVVRLVTARYQKYANDGLHTSSVALCEFSLVHPERSVTITSKGFLFGRKMQVQIHGVGPQFGTNSDPRHPKTMIEVRHFDTAHSRPNPFNWKAGEVIEPDQTPTSGDVLWQATFSYPWTGGTLMARECEIWPSAEKEGEHLSDSVYFDVFPI